MCVCCPHAKASVFVAHGGQKSDLDLLGLQSQVTVSCLVRMSGSELRSSRKAASVLDCRAVSPAYVLCTTSRPPVFTISPKLPLFSPLFEH